MPDIQNGQVHKEATNNHCAEQRSAEGDLELELILAEMGIKTARCSGLCLYSQHWEQQDGCDFEASLGFIDCLRKHKPYMVSHACTVRNWELETGGSGVQNNPKLHGKLEVTLAE